MIKNKEATVKASAARVDAKYEKILKGRKIIKYLNPYNALAMMIGYIFYPFRLIPYVNRNIMPVLKLINDLFCNSMVSAFMSLWYPLILVSILSNVGSPHFMVVGISSIIPIVVGVQAMPPIIVSLRNSSVLKRIGSTSTKSSDMTFSVIFYFFFVALVSSVINISIGMGIKPNDIHFDQIIWYQFILSGIIGILIATSFGMLCASFFKSEQSATVIGLLLTLPGAFLTAEFLTPVIVNDWGPVKYISFIFPQKLVTVLFFSSTNSHDIFSISDATTTDWYTWAETKEIFDPAISSTVDPALRASLENIRDTQLASTMNFVVVDKIEMLMTWILIPVELFAFSILSIVTFKWGTR